MNPIESVLQHGRSRPDSLAIASADFTMTAGDLAQSTLRFAARLRQLGVRKGSVVAISAHPAIEAVVTLALLHEGAVSLTGNAAVLRAHAADLDAIIADAPLAHAGRAQLITVDAEFLAGLGAVSTAIEPQLLDDDDPVRIVFSSGTTGVPKGVVFTTAGLLARTEAARAKWMPLDPFMNLLGLDTVSGMLAFFWSALHGVTFFVASTAQRNREVIEHYGVRSIKTSPARLTDLLDAVEGAPAPLQLEVVQVAGSLVPLALAARTARLLGSDPVYLYGSTEVGTVARGPFDPARPHVVGSVMPDVELQIVDGAIRYRSGSTPAGYWLTPQHPAFREGWFYPGDEGALESGALSISGRVDDVVNAGGAKFNLAELDLWIGELGIFDDAASFSYTARDGAIAVGLAFVSARSPDPAWIASQLRTRMTNLVVGTLMKIDQIPRNNLGKVDRRALSGMLKGPDA